MSSYEYSYQWDLDKVIDSSNAILAIGNEKGATDIEAVDISGNGNTGTINGPMPDDGFFKGRRYDGVDDYIDCGNDSSLRSVNNISLLTIFRPKLIAGTDRILQYKGGVYYHQIDKNTSKVETYLYGTSTPGYHGTSNACVLNTCSVCLVTYANPTLIQYLNGTVTSDICTGNLADTAVIVGIGGDGIQRPFNGVILYAAQFDFVLTQSQCNSLYNTLAVLPFWKIGYNKYSDNATSLTSIFPESSGVISSGSFIVSDGLKCTANGTITHNANYEFDGLEYITLTIAGKKYSGITTITHGTITATISQGSNDIVIDMETNDVLENIEIQFRKEI